jgi:hypothetical protein
MHMHSSRSLGYACICTFHEVFLESRCVVDEVRADRELLGSVVTAAACIVTVSPGFEAGCFDSQPPSPES